MPRDWPPELAARLAMVDSEARAAVADARANAEGGGAEPPDSDDDSLQTPGRAPSRFIVHDEYAGTPSTGRRVNIFNFFSDSDDDAMDLDSNPESMAGASEASEASTTHDTRPSNPIPNHRFGGAPSPPSPPLFSLNQDSDRENRAPLPSFESGDEADADGDGEDPFYAPHTSYQSNMYLHDPGSPVKPFLPYATAATDPTLSHLREISGLASWTVSSYKVCGLSLREYAPAVSILGSTSRILASCNQVRSSVVAVCTDCSSCALMLIGPSLQPSCGVPALLNPSTATFWQSDGPQPHLLNIHFFKLVRIVKLRVYLDFELDESYTPTRLAFAAGTHEYDAVEFAEWKWDGLGPKGWVDVDLSQCGSDEERERELIDGKHVQVGSPQISLFREQLHGHLTRQVSDHKNNTLC